MVTNPGTTASLDEVQPLNPPVGCQVRAAHDGTPKAVATKRRWLNVSLIEESWRIDDEWWRPQPISRRYYRLTLEDGVLLVIFCDLLGGSWYTQQVS